MILKTLLERLDYQLVQGSVEKEIGKLCYNSQEAEAGDLFICIAGSHFDSHTAAAEVAAAGAAALVTEKEIAPVPENVTVIRVEDTRLALACLSAAWFGYPAEKMVTIGVTGTKGKTTTTHMIRAALEAAGKKVGMIGTNGVYFGGRHFRTKNTTPESYEIQDFFDQMVKEGVEYVVMEVSSQGIMLHRVAGFTYDYGLFTNIAPDHIGPDEHKDFEEYLFYKSKLLQMCRIGCGNADDAHWEKVQEGHTCELHTFGIEKQADLMASHIHYRKENEFMGVVFDVSGEANFTVDVNIPGLFNVYNALAAISVVNAIGISPEAICRAMKTITVNGRMEVVYASDRFRVIVDYAHNEISMESLLKTLRDYHPKRLVSLFGCGGNRSPLRRYGMGEISGRLADLSIITADNSRFEAVEDIIRDIRVGMDKTDGEFVEIPDRREAIRYAIHNVKDGDVIVILGKGHEDYQEIKGVRYPFLDSAVAREVLAEEGYII